MKSRGEGGGTSSRRRRDGITAVIGIAAVAVAAIGACSLDSKNPPLPNEAPNRGQFVGGIAIGAGPGGTGGSGAGLGSGGTSPTSAGGGGPAPPNCACAAAYAADSGNCLGCFTSEQSGNCADEENSCVTDSGSPGCTELFNTLLGCGTTPGCVSGTLTQGASNAAFVNLLQCDCNNCGTMCTGGTC